jgi:hypothetical protein
MAVLEELEALTIVARSENGKLDFKVAVEEASTSRWQPVETMVAPHA